MQKNIPVKKLEVLMPRNHLTDDSKEERRKKKKRSTHTSDPLLIRLLHSSQFYAARERLRTRVVARV